MFVTFNEVPNGKHDTYDIRIIAFYTADINKINKEQLYDVLDKVGEECTALIKERLKENGYNIDMFNNITEELTFDKVVNRLIDGLEYSKEDIQKIRQWLLEYQVANKLTLKELDDLCWEDSEWVFDNIFN